MLRVYFIVLVALLVACSPTKQKVEQVSTIDSTLQIKVDSILQNKLSELNATIGHRFTFGSIGNKGNQIIRYGRCW